MRSSRFSSLRVSLFDELAKCFIERAPSRAICAVFEGPRVSLPEIEGFHDARLEAKGGMV